MKAIAHEAEHVFRIFTGAAHLVIFISSSLEQSQRVQATVGINCLSPDYHYRFLTRLARFYRCRLTGLTPSLPALNHDEAWASLGCPFERKVFVCRFKCSVGSDLGRTHRIFSTCIFTNSLHLVIGIA